jgi:predicted RNA binding protein YcfA (HicA-like mRNA interferase family)
MSQLMKLWIQVKNNPKTVSFEDANKLLTKAGFQRRQPNSGSSHYIYKKDDRMVTVPKKIPYIRESYIKQMIEAIGDFFENE